MKNVDGNKLQPDVQRDQQSETIKEANSSQQRKRQDSLLSDEINFKTDNVPAVRITRRDFGHSFLKSYFPVDSHVLFSIACTNREKIRI